MREIAVLKLRFGKKLFFLPCCCVVKTPKGCTFEYNYLNLPSKITWSAEKFIELYYSAAGQKLRKVVVDGATKTFTDYVNGLEYTNGNLDAIYHAEGRLKKLSATTYRQEYALKDHLGNTRIFFTDADKNGLINKNDIIQESHYYAFGMAYDQYPWGTNATPNKYQYNGKELNDDFGLNLSDYGARWYDAAIGRWTQVDPLTETQETFSPYHYTYDNPIRYNDPDGRMPEEGGPGDKLVAYMVGFTNAVSTNVIPIGGEQFRLDAKKFGTYGGSLRNGQLAGDVFSIGLGAMEVVLADLGIIAEVVAAPETGGLSALAIPATEAFAVHGTATMYYGLKNITGNNSKVDFDVNKKNQIPNSSLEKPTTRGNAPKSTKDGKPVEIHHEGQKNKGPFKEMTREDHRGVGNDKVNHPNKSKPSEIDRKQFNKDRREYWQKQYDNWDKRPK